MGLSCEGRRRDHEFGFQLLQLFRLTSLSIAVLSVKAFIPDIGPIRIDVGNLYPYNDTVTGYQWLADVGYAQNGSYGSIASTNLGPLGLSVVDQTLRFWKVGASCYNVPVAKGEGRYLIRVSFCYNNYDSLFLRNSALNALPVVGVNVEEQFVEAVGNFGGNASAHYSDYIATVTDAVATVCVYPLPGPGGGVVGLQPPFLNSLQILPVDSQIFGPQLVANLVLSTLIRLNAGGGGITPLANATATSGLRTWSGDESSSGDLWVPVTTQRNITIPPDLAAYGLPHELFQTARKAGKNISTGFHLSGVHAVDPQNKFLVLLYFAEIEEGVKPGERIMDVWVNGQTTLSIDLARYPGPFTAIVYQMQVRLMDTAAGGGSGFSGSIYILLTESGASTAYRDPLISGVEVYEMITPYTGKPQQGQSVSYRIDCGSSANYTDTLGLQWAADYGFSSGAVAEVLQPGNDLHLASSLRYYDSYAQNCYRIPVQTGRYLLRAFFDYGHWDESTANRSSTFAFGAEGVNLVDLWPQAPGFFESAVLQITDANADVCVFGTNETTSPPFINSIELMQLSPFSYQATGFQDAFILYTYFRINCAGPAFGYGLTADAERGHRQWTSDQTSEMELNCQPSCTSLDVTRDSQGGDMAPDYWPPLLYHTAIQGGPKGLINYTFHEIDPSSTLLLWLHFTEIDNSTAEGQRVFSVYLNGAPANLQGPKGVLTSVDIVKESGGAFRTLDVYANVTLAGATLSDLNVVLAPSPSSTKGPILSGLEVLRAFPNALLTDASQVGAMKVLRDALGVGEKLSWQGDPCVPYPWYGVKCEVQVGYNTVSSIDLSGEGLMGYLPEAVRDLESLVYCNLSGNHISDRIPPGFGNLANIATLDLSGNNLNSSIPPDLASVPTLTTLLLNSNNLEGPLPTDLAPAPTRLQVNISNNPRLCGGGGLPSCHLSSAPDRKSVV